MYYRNNQIVLTKREAITLIEAIIETALEVWSKGYLKTLAFIFHTFIVKKQSIHRNEYDRFMMIRERIGLAPVRMIIRSGLYYRALYDRSTSNDDRQRAHSAWARHIDVNALSQIDYEWGEETMGIIETFRDAGVHPDIISGITRWLVESGSLWISEEAAQMPGELRIISSG